MDLNNTLKGSIILLVVFAIVFLVVQTNRILNTATTSNTVSFSGEGKVLAKPDIAVLNLAIVTEANTSKEAQDRNSESSNKVVNFLKSKGVDEKNVKTSSYNISPLYSYPGPRSPELTEPRIYGYRVSQSLTVKIRDLDNASEILDGAVTAGANQVSGLSFEIDDPDELTSEAREMAIEDAKAKAKELEKQLGVKLGKIVNYSEGGTPSILLRSAAMDKVIGGGGPSLPTGENEVIVNVTLTYQIK